MPESLVLVNRLHDAHHLHEGNCPFLHSGTARGWRGYQRKPLGRCPAHGCGNTPTRAYPYRAAEKAKLAHDDGHSSTKKCCSAGHDRFVKSRDGARIRKFASVSMFDPEGRSVDIPCLETISIEDKFDQLEGSEMSHRSSHSLTIASCCPSNGGGV
jgi:hypothetical protein